MRSMSRSVFILALLLWALPASAQMMGMNMAAGGGGNCFPAGGQQGAPGMGMPDGDDDEVKEAQKNLKEAKKELSKLKSKLSSLRSQISSKKDLFRVTGFENDAFSLIENHITGGLSCSNYQQKECDPAGDCSASSDSTTPTSPFRAGVWKQSCGPGNGDVSASICSQNVNRSAGYNSDSCRRNLRDWISKQRELRDSERQIAELDAKVKELAATAKEKQTEQREAMKEKRREQTEGGCIECMMAGNGGGGGGGGGRRTNSWEVAANVVLGLGAMYMGNQSQRYAVDQNARLGFQTQTVSPLMFGAPYFGNALTSLAGGGSSGCGGMGGSMGMMGGYGLGSYGGYGMMNGYGMGLNRMGSSPYSMLPGYGYNSGYGTNGMGLNAAMLTPTQQVMLNSSPYTGLNQQMQSLQYNYSQALMTMNSGGYWGLYGMSTPLTTATGYPTSLPTAISTVPSSR